MIVNRPKRLSTFSYTGYHRYFLTICTYHRRRMFVEPSVVRETLSHVRQSARDFRFALCEVFRAASELEVPYGRPGHDGGL
jgi:hypothetical protein